jgi:glycerophosphoryl diester phosphodiesterase
MYTLSFIKSRITYFLLFFFLVNLSLLSKEQNSTVEEKQISASNMPFNRPKDLKVIAHRGASDIAPENTMSAFKKAVDLESDFIELDLHLSKDLVPVIIHDKTLLRTTNSFFKFFVKNQPLSVLKALDAGSWFSKRFKEESIPTLSEVLKLKKKRTGLMLEIKAEDNPRLIVSSIKKELAKHSYEEGKIILGSKNSEIIKELKKQIHHLPSIAIIESDNQEEMLNLETPFIALDIEVLKKEGAKKFSQNNQNLWVWTVNNEKDLELCLEEGVQGVITDKVNWVQDLLPEDLETT